MYSHRFLTVKAYFGFMKEIEAKILQVNREKIEATLVSLGARKVFDGEIQTFFFDFKDNSIIKAKNVLRLRKEEEKTDLTYKKVRVTQGAKVAEEYSVEVSDFETMKKILESIGLEATENMQKHRVSYLLNNARFDIDHYLEEYSFIPEFLEIEAESEEAIHRYAGLLGFKQDDCLPWSTNELIKYYSSAKENRN
jgi:predicted adenylyl cyclase CyaB